MKTLSLALAATASLLALAACNPKPKTVVVDTNPDPMANELARAKPVELPPTIKADKTFRCKDDSLVYVTFFEGDKQASIKVEPTGPATVVKATAAGEAKTAEGGWKLTGSENAIELTRPGKPAQACKA